ncbi:MAG: hypothetical protein AAGL17_09510 [Cyanobacteria bacterium J06576_12]
MQLTENYLAECETLIGQSKTPEVLKRLLAVKDETGYKNVILSLSSRWKLLDRETMTGTASTDERKRAYSRINSNLLHLIDAMRGELKGEKVDKHLLQEAQPAGHLYRPVWQTYLPILLTAIGVWAISYFAYRPVAVACSQDYDLAGQWEIDFRDSTQQKRKIGSAQIKQESCQNSFQMSGEVYSSIQDRNVDFSSRIGGLNDGEIFFVYENFDSEMGVCRGVIPADASGGFMVSCIDLIGRDRNDQAELELWFKPVLTNGETQD